MYRILIADDEVIERKVLSRKLQRNFEGECEITEAANGREVLELFDRVQPQILILDIEMPGISGLEAAEKLREQGSNVAIIFLTAFDEFSYAKKAVSVHALDYLLKPCDDKELVSAVSEGMRYASALSAQNAQAQTQVQAHSDAASAEQDKNVSGLSSSTPEMGDNQSQSGAGAPASSGLAQQEQMLHYIEDHFMENIAVQNIAESMGYSEAYFCKLFKQYFGQSFVTYLTDYRIRTAIRLFASEDNLGVGEIGNAVGYPDPNYFAKVFKRVTGKSPTEYRSESAR